MQLIYDRLMKERGILDILQSSELGSQEHTVWHYMNEDVNVLHIIIE